MPRIGFQISTPVLLETQQQLLEPPLYAQCFVSPIPGLYLDHIEVGVQGPITQSADLGGNRNGLNCVIIGETGPALRAVKSAKKGQRGTLSFWSLVERRGVYCGENHELPYQALRGNSSATRELFDLLGAIA